MDSVSQGVQFDKCTYLKYYLLGTYCKTHRRFVWEYWTLKYGNNFSIQILCIIVYGWSDLMLLQATTRSTNFETCLQPRRLVGLLQKLKFSIIEKIMVKYLQDSSYSSNGCFQRQGTFILLP